MKGMSPVAFALAVAVFAAPAVAQTSLILPPYDGSPAPKIATEQQALAALQAHGVVDVQRLGRVGDYWEGAGLERGRPVVAYVFTSGAIETRQASPDQLHQALRALPPAG